MEIKIFIATYKEYELPKEKCYYPIFSGAAISDSYNGQYPGDDTGDNISKKNLQYNELDVLYWGWKNTLADVKGLCHHRRYMGRKKGDNSYDNLLTAPEIEKLLETYDVIVPTRRKFYIMSSYAHYIYSKASYKKVHITDLENLRKIVAKQTPEYLPALEKVYKSRSAYMLNMEIMKDELFNKYCTWLFSILSDFESHINEYRVDTTRCCGAMGEFLLATFIEANHLKVAEMPIIERENLSLYTRVKNRIKLMIK